MTDSLSPPVLQVAAGIIVGDGKVLAACRAAADSNDCLWEFPGGKREGSESIVDTLQREIKEELGITLKEVRPLAVVWWRSKNFTLELHGLLAKPVDIALLEARVHRVLHWCSSSELRAGTVLGSSWMPADVLLAHAVARLIG